MSLAEVRDATVAYRRGFVALDSVSCAIEAGERVAIVGGSGSGKTTLARLLLGLVPPAAGDVLFQGRSIVGLKEKNLGWLRASASMVFQDPHSSLDPRMRLRDIVIEPLRSTLLRGRLDVPQPTTHVAAEALKGVDLDEGLLQRYPHQLSGGQRQRLAIARALISEPSLLVADEPVSALDVSVRAQVLRILSAQVAERGVALLLISHDLLVVRHMCDRVIVLERGRVVEQGPVAEVLETPRHLYTQALVDATLTL